VAKAVKNPRAGPVRSRSERQAWSIAPIGKGRFELDESRKTWRRCCRTAEKPSGGVERYLLRKISVSAMARVPLEQSSMDT